MNKLAKVDVRTKTFLYLALFQLTVSASSILTLNKIVSFFLCKDRFVLSVRKFKWVEDPFSQDTYLRINKAKHILVKKLVNRSRNYTKKRGEFSDTAVTLYRNL